jgi:hypothetical protein
LAVSAKRFDLDWPCPTNVLFQNEVNQKARSDDQREQGTGHGLTDPRWALWAQYRGSKLTEIAACLKSQAASQSKNESEESAARQPVDAMVDHGNDGKIVV